VNAEHLPFALAVKPALLAYTAPISMWAALEGKTMVGDLIAGVVGKIIDRDATEVPRALRVCMRTDS
jgi:hypothetical protein